MALNELIIITGMSGSGKHTLAKSFEDLGYFCVDNLPVQLIPHLVRLAEGQANSLTHLAVVVDVREGSFLEGFRRLHEQLKRGKFRTHILFLEAADAVLVKRFSETRRPHPLAKGQPILEGIRKERRRLKILRNLADMVVDTSDFTVHAARRFVSDHFRLLKARTKSLVMTVVSFGFKYGVPLNSDLVFDVRFLPNPHFVRRLHRMTGDDAAVVKYLERFPETGEIKEKISELLLYLHPKFLKEGKAYLTVAIGCTGGRHRSVAIANAVASKLQDAGLEVGLFHRDVHKSEEEVT
jgi:RNase adapter protein RapZ